MSLDVRCRNKVGKRWKDDTEQVQAEFYVVEMRLMKVCPRAGRVTGTDPPWQAVSISVHTQLFARGPIPSERSALRTRDSSGAPSDGPFPT
jgi:hypothetical protein